MSLSPTNILQRLQQLKVWQESHEELLKKTKNLVNTSNASDYQTIEGLSAFDTTNETKNWESQVISPTKSFNELLEEKLAQDPGPENVAPKPKKPFLKKGAGLERYRLKPKIRKRKSVTPLRAPDLSVKAKATWCKIDSGDQINEKSGPGDQTLYEKQLEKELLIFEALEQRADNSSFCSTNSSVVRILSSTPSKIQPAIAEEKRVHWESQSDDDDVIETNLEKRDIAEILLRLKSLATKPNPPSSEDEKWSSDDTSITSTDLEATLQSEKRDVAVGTENSRDDCPFCGAQIQEKISEYENQISDVIHDRNRIAEFKKALDQKERDFLKKRRDFEDQKQDLLFELETERKKLVKERQVFQAYVKDSQNRPNKKERQEISNLKQEVADLSETLKLKESKNGMTQARLRNQIKQLEKENSNLKDEVEKLTKENAKLSATQKLSRKSSDTKILHEINKNISKLTKETRKSEPVKKKTLSMDAEDSLLDMGNVEVQYENAFRNLSLPDVSKKGCANQTTSDSHVVGSKPIRNLSLTDNSEKTERTLDDGSTQIRYPNGNVKTVSPDGNLITINYFNGDKQETNLFDGTVKYYFGSKNICQTTYADGLEVVEFPEGVTEKRYSGICEVILPDGVIQTTYPDGTQETKYTDGSVVKLNKNGEKILLLPNGQKEIETKEYKRREYPDGTIKILYPDGTQETKYANGRVRIKDGNGTLILDTQS